MIPAAARDATTRCGGGIARSGADGSIPRVTTPRSWPLTWPAPNARGDLPCSSRPATNSSERYRDIVAARSRRVPLQHLTGTAAFGPVLLHVGPGVFIPRPETEAILAWATAQRLPARPVIVDLCTGSGALAVGAGPPPARPARVIGIDDSDAALEYARRNAEGTAVELVRADVTDSDGLLRRT